MEDGEREVEKKRERESVCVKERARVTVRVIRATSSEAAFIWIMSLRQLLEVARSIFFLFYSTKLFVSLGWKTLQAFYLHNQKYLELLIRMGKFILCL